LLKADEGLSDEEIAEKVATSLSTVEQTRQRFVEENLAALKETRAPVLAKSGQPVRYDYE